MAKKESKVLTYESQLEFKHWAQRHGISKKNGADFYFDYVTPVDSTSPTQIDIPGFYADGTKTWGEALAILKRYFKVA